MAQKFPEPLSGLVMPRFGEVATFMRLPVERDPAKLDIALVGVPWDGGTTNRPGARHGPREIRNMSTLMRRPRHTPKAPPLKLRRGRRHPGPPPTPPPPPPPFSPPHPTPSPHPPPATLPP